ncbi:RING-H2 finger protein ATL63-like [Aristolochia californica]|uniref:RING-H2 finger protein ATL63-like n=1 Tax=Aristolochia californica TaxID=171875 RepID=UPI0035E2ED81
MSRPFYSSYNENAMLVAVIFLLIVTTVMLLLHFYAKWRFERRRRGIDPLPTAVVSHLRDPFSAVDHAGDGLDPSLVASLPVFVYKAGECKNAMVCVVCLSVMEEDEMGRMLPKCGHCFHVGCIDKWLLSHSSCPICRSEVGLEEALALSTTVELEEESLELEQSHTETECVEEEYGNGEDRTSPIAEIVVDVPPDLLIENRAGTGHSSSSSLSCSLKRMLSRDRFENKVHPSVQVDDGLKN